MELRSLKVAFHHPSGLTEWIWNAMTGEVEAELKGHMNYVMSVAFSQDGSQVVSGSVDNTVRIWNVKIGEVEPEPNVYMGLLSAALSQSVCRRFSDKG